MLLTLLKKHLQTFFVYSYGKWFYKVLGRTIPLKFSLYFNDLMNYLENFPEYRAVGHVVWSGVFKLFFWMGNTLVSAAHPVGVFSVVKKPEIFLLPAVPQDLNYNLKHFFSIP